MNALSSRRRRRVRPALILWALCLLGIAPAALYTLHVLWNRYPDGPQWVQQFTDARVAKAVSAQRLSGQTIHVALSPEDASLHAEALLEVESTGHGLEAVVFMLNPGLDVFSASAGEEPLPIARQGALVRIGLPLRLPQGQRAQVLVTYGGTIAGTAMASGSIGPREVWLPWAVAWHPVDFSSFAALSATVSLPEGMTLAGTAERALSAKPGRVSYHVQTARPRMGMPLVAGHYATHRAIHGDIQWEIDHLPGEEWAVETYSEVFPSAESVLRMLLGETQKATLHGVVSGRVQKPFYLGCGLVALPPASGVLSHADIARLGGALARHWWGETVSPSWFPLRADGGAWLLEGGAAHSGWTVLRELRGHNAAMEYIEMRVLRGTQTPLRALNAMDLARLDDASQEALEEHGARIARLLESSAGREGYWEACRNLFRIHAGHTVTLDAFRRELELATQKDFRETFRVWFDRPGVFDYTVEGVRTVGNKVEVTVSNNGDIPALVPVTLGLVTARGLDLHAIEPGSGGGTFAFDVDAAVNRVILDPYFETPDTNRANNVWPRRTWPQALAVASDGKVAVGLARQWESGSPDMIRLLQPGQPGAEHIRLLQPLSAPLLWSPDGTRLAFGAAGAFVRHSDGQITEAAARHPGKPAGWMGEILVLHSDPGVSPGWMVSRPPHEAVVGQEAFPPPRPGTVAYCSSRRAYACVSQDDGSVWVGEDGGPPRKAEEHGGIIAGPVFHGPGRLRFVRATGVVAEIEKVEGKWVETKVAELGHGVAQARLSPDGNRVAWRHMRRPHLMSSPLAIFEPAPLRVMGTPVDFCWQDSRTLFCLTRQNEWALPGRFHAEYNIQQIDTVSGETVVLDETPGR